MHDDSQHPLRIMTLIGILCTFVISLLFLIQVFTDGVLG